MQNDEYSNLKKIMGKIKSSNFNFGESKNDYKSSFSDAYNFNADKAQSCRGILDSDKIKDLKATHYALGTDRNNFVTSTSATYQPKNVTNFVRYDNKDVKKSSIDFEAQSNIKAEERMKSLYMIDYSKKQIE